MGIGGFLNKQMMSAKAIQGDADAQCSLGLCYWKGEGVAQDKSEAIHWYWRAAEQEYLPAQVQMGFACYGGIGVDKDFTEAVRWLQAPAEQGNEMAQTILHIIEDILPSP